MALLLSAALLMSSCAPSNLPPPQWHRVEGSTVTDRKFSPEGEYYLGRAVAANLLRNYGPDDDERAGRYLALLTTYMAYANDLPVPYQGYSVAILATQQSSAFSSPGGHVLISRGLLNAVRSEEELAGVIAHELGHLRNQDGIRSVGNAKATSLMTAMGTLVASMVGGGGLAGALLQTFEGAVDHAVTDLVARGFSRQQEIFADQAAVELMKGCGYPPGAYLQFLTRTLSSPQDSEGSLFSTHPMSGERIARLQEILPGEAGEVPSVPARERRFKIALR